MVLGSGTLAVSFDSALIIQVPFGDRVSVSFGLVVMSELTVYQLFPSYVVVSICAGKLS